MLFSFMIGGRFLRCFDEFVCFFYLACFFMTFLKCIVGFPIGMLIFATMIRAVKADFEHTKRAWIPKG